MKAAPRAPMKVLFLMDSPEYLRFYDTAIAELAARGDEVDLAVMSSRAKKLVGLEVLRAHAGRLRLVGVVRPRRAGRHRHGPARGDGLRAVAASHVRRRAGAGAAPGRDTSQGQQHRHQDDPWDAAKVARTVTRYMGSFSEWVGSQYTPNYDMWFEIADGDNGSRTPSTRGRPAPTPRSPAGRTTSSSTAARTPAPTSCRTTPPGQTTRPCRSPCTSGRTCRHPAGGDHQVPRERGGRRVAHVHQRVPDRAVRRVGEYRQRPSDVGLRLQEQLGTRTRCGCGTSSTRSTSRTPPVGVQHVRRGRLEPASAPSSVDHVKVDYHWQYQGARVDRGY